MPDSNVERVLAKALTDDAFRNRLVSDPKAVCDKYGLSKKERSVFANFEEKRLELVKSVEEKGLGMAM